MAGWAPGFDAGLESSVQARKRGGRGTPGEKHLSDLDLEFGSATDVGLVRRESQDRHGFLRGGIGQMLVVCDGMGGQPAGDVAAAIACDTILAIGLAAGAEIPPDELVHLSIQAGHRAIHQAVVRDPRLTGMGTTCVVALVRDGQCTIGNVGDSRAYMIRAGQIRQVTQDQTKAQLMFDLGLIDHHTMLNHPERCVLVQALGQPSELKPQVGEIELQHGDQLLLCSDGLYGGCSDARMHEQFARGTSQDIADQLVVLANHLDGTDNSTAIVARVLPAVGERREERWQLGELLGRVGRALRRAS